HQVARGQVHAIARSADAQRRLAGHGTSDHDLVETELLDFTRLFPTNHFVFADNHLIRHGIGDGVATHAAADRFTKGPFNLLAFVDHALADALGGSTVVHGDNDILGDVG